MLIHISFYATGQKQVVVEVSSKSTLSLAGALILDRQNMKLHSGPISTHFPHINVHHIVMSCALFDFWNCIPHVNGGIVSWTSRAEYQFCTLYLEANLALLQLPKN